MCIIRKPPKAFINWLNEKSAQNAKLSVESGKYFDDQNNKQNPNVAKKNFIDQVNHHLENNDHFDVIIDRISVNLKDKEITINGGGKHKSINNLSYKGPENVKLNLSSLKIGKLTLYGSEPGIGMYIDNCYIDRLVLKQHSVVFLKNTYIKTIRLPQGANIRRIDMRNGCVLNIDCPLPNKENPFGGPVWFGNVFFPRTTKNKHYLTDPQPYRNMRYFLNAIGNHRMAHLFNACILALEREDERSWINNCFTRSYDILSDFGLSVVRPLGWLLFITVTSFIALWVSCGAVPVSSAEELYSGWRGGLDEYTSQGNLLRAFYLSLQPIVNPLGIFSYKPIVLPANTFIAALLIIQALLSVTLIALLIVALRRRFRMQ